MSLLNFFGIQDVYAAGATAAAGAASSSQGSSMQMLVLPVLLIVVFYFLLIRPQNRRAKEQRLMLSKVAIGDEVMTAAGIAGRVVSLGDPYLVLRVAKNVEVTFQKSAVVMLLPKGTLEIID